MKKKSIIIVLMVFMSITLVTSISAIPTVHYIQGKQGIEQTAQSLLVTLKEKLSSNKYPWTSILLTLIKILLLLPFLPAYILIWIIKQVTTEKGMENAT